MEKLQHLRESALLPAMPSEDASRGIRKLDSRRPVVDTELVDADETIEP